MSIRDERDYILRMIAVAAAAVARLRKLLTGEGSASEIAREARSEQDKLLGKDANLLNALDAASAASFMANKETLAVWADLVQLEADALRAAGETERADARERRARALGDILPK
jgi:hypothetical protein